MQRSERRVGYVCVEAGARARLARAQNHLETSIRAFGLEPLAYPAGERLVELGDVLANLRRETTHRAFVWCNSDLVLTRDPYDVPDENQVYGFNRREVPSGEFNEGVDMFYVPTKIWDDVLSRDVPKLYVGASFVDWWIPRIMAHVGGYTNLRGYIDHVTHATSAASGSDSNFYYQKNFRAFNHFAIRNGLETIPAPPFLVLGIGHVWGVRDLIRKCASRVFVRRPSDG